jgi:hypothetical protein
VKPRTIGDLRARSHPRRTDPEMYTVPVALRTFVDSTAESSWGALFAMSVVSLIPIFPAVSLRPEVHRQGIRDDRPQVTTTPEHPL